MNDMTLPFRQMLQNSIPGGLQCQSGVRAPDLRLPKQTALTFTAR